MPRNMLVILTDDQRFDTLWAMPLLQAQCAARGVLFSEAVVSSPICCPSRVSLLSGGYYVHTTGVLTNSLPYGGATLFDDSQSLPVQLQAAGYQTALIGKYLNGYDTRSLRIPPGWSQFVTKSRGTWQDFSVSKGSSTAVEGQGHLEDQSQYLTDYLRDEVLTFLSGVGAQPFFLLFTPSAPHSPATPALGDEALFADYLYRGRGYGSIGNETKPAYVQARRPPDEAANDLFHRNQLRSLVALDRAIGDILTMLDTTGLIHDTLVVFTSDNGYMWGEHGLDKKGAPYEESVRVPLVMVAPGIASRDDRNLPVSNLDIPATMAAMANLPYGGDGINLLPLLADRSLRIRPAGTFLEAYQQGGIPTTWAAWRTREYKYVEHRTGEVELYDLATDPYELMNVADNPAYEEAFVRMATRTNRYKHLDLQGDVGEGPDEDEEDEL